MAGHKQAISFIQQYLRSILLFFVVLFVGVYSSFFDPLTTLSAFLNNTESDFDAGTYTGTDFVSVSNSVQIPIVPQLYPFPDDGTTSWISGTDLIHL
jgi:hypothetical protein